MCTFAVLECEKCDALHSLSSLRRGPLKASPCAPFPTHTNQAPLDTTFHLCSRNSTLRFSGIIDIEAKDDMAPCCQNHGINTMAETTPAVAMCVFKRVCIL